MIIYTHVYSQVTVGHTRPLVTMEGAFLNMLGVMAIMTVETTVMKMDVCDGRWEETVFYFFARL